MSQRYVVDTQHDCPHVIILELRTQFDYQEIALDWVGVTVEDGLCQWKVDQCEYTERRK